MECLLGDHVRAMFGLCWYHVLPNFISRPVSALKFSRLIQHDLRHMCTESILYETISDPCLDPVGNMICLAVVTDQ